MTTRFKTLATSALLLGSVGALGLSALAPAQPAESAAPPLTAARNSPTIVPLLAIQSAHEVVAQVTSHTPITRLRLLVDGRPVAAQAVRYDAAQHRVSYDTAALASGRHVARLTVWDRSGAYRWQEWTFSVARPTITVRPTSGAAGTTVTLSGQGWPQGTRVVLSLGGAATGAGGSYGVAAADARGGVTMRARLAALPNGAPLSAGPVTLLVHNGDGSLKATAVFTVTR